LICGENIHRMKTHGKSIVQLVLIPRRFPNRHRANTASGVWQKEAIIDTRSLDANRSFTLEQVASSIKNGGGSDV
jgi:hypothetical protein